MSRSNELLSSSTDDSYIHTLPCPPPSDTPLNKTQNKSKRKIHKINIKNTSNQVFTQSMLKLNEFLNLKNLRNIMSLLIDTPQASITSMLDFADRIEKVLIFNFNFFFIIFIFYFRTHIHRI